MIRGAFRTVPRNRNAFGNSAAASRHPRGTRGLRDLASSPRRPNTQNSTSSLSLLTNRLPRLSTTPSQASSSFHSSAPKLADPRYTRFGGQTSSSSGGPLGRVVDNFKARFNDPGSRYFLFAVLGLGGACHSTTLLLGILARSKSMLT